MPAQPEEDERSDTLCIRPVSVKVLHGSLEPGFKDAGDSRAGQLNFPQQIWQLDANTLLIADRANGRIRKLDLMTNKLSSLVGCGGCSPDQKDGVGPVSASAAHLFNPAGVCIDPTRAASIFFCDDDVQKCIRRLDLNDMTVTIVAGRPDAPEVDPDNAVAMDQWVRACLRPQAAGLDAVFSDTVCLFPAKLKGQDETLVYIACMSSNTIKSFHPSTRTIFVCLF
jgi:hypothetical protein